MVWPAAGRTQTPAEPQRPRWSRDHVRRAWHTRFGMAPGTPFGSNNPFFHSIGYSTSSLIYEMSAYNCSGPPERGIAQSPAWPIHSKCLWCQVTFLGVAELCWGTGWPGFVGDLIDYQPCSLLYVPGVCSHACQSTGLLKLLPEINAKCLKGKDLCIVANRWISQLPFLEHFLFPEPCSRHCKPSKK